MARRPADGDRVLGPYPDRGGFRVIRIEKDGRRNTLWFKQRAEADGAVAGLRHERPRGRTIGEALTAYEDFMLHDKGNKPNSVDQTQRKLRRFFDDVHVELAALDPDACEALYEGMRTSKRRVAGRPGRGRTPTISVDYHRNALSEAKTFLNWCVKQAWLETNPLAGVEGVGRRRHGKEQLRIDEARRWMARATELADQGEPGAIAALMTLIMGMRCSEIVSRTVRDLDDQGRVLWITDSKTAKGKRTLQVPERLRRYLLGLCEGKKPVELIFGAHDRGWPRAWVQRICGEAGVQVVTAHGQRGLHSTLAVEVGVTARAVADALGHESFTTTARSYARPEAVGHARQARAIRVLEGGADGGQVGAESLRIGTIGTEFHSDRASRRTPETPKGPASLRDP